MEGGTATGSELRRRAAQQSSVAELGRLALTGTPLEELMDEAVRLLAEGLGVEYAKVLELEPDGERLRLRAGIGWADGLVGVATVGAGLDSQAGYTLLHAEPVVVTDLLEERRFNGPPLLHDHGVRSGVSMIIRGGERPWGVLGAHTRELRRFAADDVSFLRGVANVLAATIAHAAAVEERERAREGLAFLAEASLVLSSSLDHRETLQRLAELAVPRLGDRCAIELADGHDRRLVALAQVERAPDGGHSIAVPLAVRGSTLGTMTLTRASAAYADDDLLLAEDVARRAAIAVENARLYEDEQRARAEVERQADWVARLQRVTARLAEAATAAEVGDVVVHEGAAALAADAGWIATVSADGEWLEMRAATGYQPEPTETYRRLSMSLVNPTVESAREGRPFWFADAEQVVAAFPSLEPDYDASGLQAMAIVPIAGTRRGVIALNFREPHEFDEGERVLLLTLARQCAQALERARLHDEHERRAEAAERTARIESASRALAEATTPQEVLDAVLTSGLDAAEARAGLIALVAEDGATLEIVAQRGYAPERMERWRRFPLDGPLPLSDAVRRQTAVYIESTPERDERYPALAHLPEASHALACLPLVAEGRALGGLVLSFASEQEFDEGRRTLEETLAAQAAQALARTRLQAAERELRERFAFLAEASALLGSSLDYETTIRRLGEIAVPRLADWFVLDMLTDDGRIERLAVAHPDPRKVAWARALERRYLPKRDDPYGPARAIATGEPQFTPDVTPELIDATIVDEDLRAAVHGLGMRSTITVPLTARGRTFGALTLIAAESARRYTRLDLELATELGQRVAIAVDNARLYRAAEERADAARALAHVEEAVLLLDRAGTIRFANERARELFEVGDPIGRPAGEALASWSDLAASADGGEGRVIVPATIGGADRWLSVSVVRFDDGAVYTLRDVSGERALEQARAEFVATASHELRTPLAAVYGAAQTLLRRDLTLTDSERAQMLELVSQESERLSRIVDDLLWASRLDASAEPFATEPIDAAHLAASVLDSAAHRAGERISLRLDAPQGLPHVGANPDRLRQVLVNLVDNAIKYSPGGGEITVRLATDNGRLRIAVSDQGIGIPQQARERIFEKFYRVDPNLTGGVGGTGLGLFIAHELVRRMQGAIRVESREGEGSTFTVELPTA